MLDLATQPARAAVGATRKPRRRRSRRGRLPPILDKRRRILAAALLANGALQGALAIALPFAILSTEFDTADGFGAEELQALGLISALGAALLVLRAIGFQQSERLGLNYVAQVRMRLFDGLTSGRTKTGHGAAMSRLMNDLSALKNWVGYGAVRSISAALALVGCILAAAAFSTWHAVAILLPCALIGSLAALLARPLLTRFGDVRRKRGRLANLLGEALLALETFRVFDQTERHRRRVRQATRDLDAALMRRMRIAAVLRAAPDALMPLAIVTAIAMGLPLRAESIGLMLLAGLASGPLRQILRAIEFRAAFLAARERLVGALSRPSRSNSDTAAHEVETTLEPPIAGVEVIGGPPADALAQFVEQDVLIVSPDSDVLRRSLARNIDLCRRFKDEEKVLEDIAKDCGLLERKRARDGLATELHPAERNLDQAWRARLSLARALASGASTIAVHAPVLLLEPADRRMLSRLSEKYALRLLVVVGDLSVDWPTLKTPSDGHGMKRRRRAAAVE
ncbi:MAG: ABC transporter transmembrane domain-containing protein [Neomegalonema sp.]